MPLSTMSSDLAEILACERQRVGELRGAIHRLSLQVRGNTSISPQIRIQHQVLPLPRSSNG